MVQISGASFGNSNSFLHDASPFRVSNDFRILRCRFESSVYVIDVSANISYAMLCDEIERNVNGLMGRKFVLSYVISDGPKCVIRNDRDTSLMMYSQRRLDGEFVDMFVDRVGVEFASNDVVDDLVFDGVVEPAENFEASVRRPSRVLLEYRVPNSSGLNCSECRSLSGLSLLFSDSNGEMRKPRSGWNTKKVGQKPKIRQSPHSDSAAEKQAKGLVLEKYYKKSDSAVLEIINCFDLKSNTFKFGNKYVPLLPEDVTDALGIPSTGKKIDICTRHIEKRKDKFCLQNFTSRSQLKRATIEATIPDKLKGQTQEEARDAVRLICLYFCISILFTNSGHSIGWFILHRFEKLEDIGSFNWAAATVDFLIRAIVCHKCKATRVSGCTPLLLCIPAIQGREDFQPGFLKWDLKQLALFLNNNDIKSIEVPYARRLYDITVPRSLTDYYPKQRKKRKESEPKTQALESSKKGTRHSNKKSLSVECLGSSHKSQMRGDLTVKRISPKLKRAHKIQKYEKNAISCNSSSSSIDTESIDSDTIKTIMIESSSSEPIESIDAYKVRSRKRMKPKAKKMLAIENNSDSSTTKSKTLTPSFSEEMMQHPNQRQFSPQKLPHTKTITTPLPPLPSKILELVMNRTPAIATTTRIAPENLITDPLRTPPVADQLIDVPGLESIECTPEVVRVLRFEKETLTSDYSRSKEKVKQKEFQLTRLQSEREQLHKENRSIIIKYTRTQWELEVEREKSAHLTTELNAMTTLKESLERECNKRRLEDTCHRRFIQKRDEEIQRLMIESAKIPSFQLLSQDPLDNSNQTDNVPSLQEVIEKYEASIKKAGRLQNEVAQLQIRLQVERSNATEIIARKDGQIAELQEQVKKLQNDLELARISNNGLNAAASRISGTLNFTNKELENERRETKMQADQIENLQKINVSLSTELNSLRDRVNRYDQEIKTKEKTPSSLVKNLKQRPRRAPLTKPGYLYDPIPGHKNIEASKRNPKSTAIPQPSNTTTKTQSNTKPITQLWKTVENPSPNKATVEKEITVSIAPNVPNPITTAASTVSTVPITKQPEPTMSTQELQKRPTPPANIARRVVLQTIPIDLCLLPITPVPQYDETPSVVDLDNYEVAEVDNRALKPLNLQECEVAKLLEPHLYKRLVEYMATTDIGFEKDNLRSFI
ncbi:hypothetical protein LguiA_034054 [Lonicera macranthoides]